MEDEDEKDEKDGEKKESSYTTATHVQTPNGLKGTILGKQRGLWGDQVTIRLENGRIARFDVTPDDKWEWITEQKAASLSPLTRLQEKLAAPIDDQD